MDNANHYVKLMGCSTLKRRAQEHALPQGESGLQITNLDARLITGGWPTPKDNYLFSGCSFTLANRSKQPFPASAVASQWVTLDFYIATTNNRAQGLSGLLHIGDVQWHVNLGGGEQNQCALEPNDLYNMSRRVTGHLKRMIPGLPYYLYAQVRNETDSQQLTGSFTEQTFTQIPHIAEQGRSVAGRAVATFVAALFFASKLFLAGPAITK